MFLGSSTLLSWFGDRRTENEVVCFGLELSMFTTNNVSIVSTVKRGVLVVLE